jgi:hypothetical protein
MTKRIDNRKIDLTLFYSIVGITIILYFIHYFNLIDILFSIGVAIVLLIKPALTIQDMKVMPLSPIDQLDIQRQIDMGNYKNAVILTLQRAYGLSEEEILKLGPQRVNELLYKLAKEVGKPVPVS